MLWHWYAEDGLRNCPKDERCDRDIANRPLQLLPRTETANLLIRNHIHIDNQPEQREKERDPVPLPEKWATVLGRAHHISVHFFLFQYIPRLYSYRKVRPVELLHSGTP